LRERVEDIPALAWSFIDEFAQSFGKTIESISEESLRELQRYRWPGNVRELRNVIERAVILAGYSRGFDWKLCGEIGSLAAVYCLEQRGPQSHAYTRQEFVERFRKHFDDGGKLAELL
jgi:transcriptional regulator with PAS, ATPase and Fis domain